MIEVKNLNFAFGKRTILNNINLKLDRGEIIGVIGANGSGKTTLLKAIAGVYPTKEMVFVDGVAIESLSFKERAKRIAMMHQNTALNFNFSAREIVAIGRYVYSSGFQRLVDTDKEIIERAMKKTNTWDLADRNIRHLSGGEQQRVHLTKTLVQETPYILFDEPSSALDLRYEKDIFEQIKLLAEQNIGTIVNIHKIKIAAKYCHRLILLADGGILADGKAEEVITVQNMKKAYDVDVDVYYNQRSKQIDFIMLD